MFAKRQYKPQTPSRKRLDTKQSVKGLFINTVWHCDCSPRLPAERFKVKKEGVNKGKWFLTCQNEPGKRCGFFIWADEAQRREASAVLNNSRSEPKQDAPGMFGAVPMTPITTKKSRFVDSGTDSEAEESPSRRKSENHPLKRSASIAGLDDDEDYGGFPIAGFEELVTSQTMSPETPAKVHAGSYPTPETSTVLKKRLLPWLQQEEGTAPFKNRIDELTTPSKPQRDAHLAPVITTPDRPIEAVNGAPKKGQRYRDALSDPDDESSVLVKEVLAELADCNVPPDKLTKIRSILSQHELQALGVLKGRDATRMALQKQKDNAAKLEAKIMGLEGQLQLARAIKTAGKAAALRR